jgi:hypothetical protein
MFLLIRRKEIIQKKGRKRERKKEKRMSSRFNALVAVIFPTAVSWVPML